MKEYKTLRELPGIPVGTIFNENQEIRIGFHMKPGCTEGTGWFEEIPESPSRKYEEALRQRKRVFILQVGDGNKLLGQMIDINDPRIPGMGRIQEYTAKENGYYIEGEDIPVKPSTGKLDVIKSSSWSNGIFGEFQFEFTGECRVPKPDEFFVNSDATSIINSISNLERNVFSGKRWILRKLIPFAYIDSKPIYIRPGHVSFGDINVKNSVLKNICKSLKY